MGPGTISEAEWDRSVDAWYPPDVDVMTFGDLDADGDSELDADEFDEQFDLSALGEAWTVEPLDQQRFHQAYFDALDNDGDGQVTEPEFKSGRDVIGTAGPGA